MSGKSNRRTYRKQSAQHKDPIHLLLSDAKQGHAKAQFELACKYYEGKGTNKDDTQAFHYFELAANQGHAEAQFDLALMFYDGEGTNKDYKQALHYYQLAANQDHSLSLNNLGKIYMTHRTLQNYKLAYQYSKQAYVVKDKILSSGCHLGLLHEYGFGCYKSIYKV